MPVAGSKLRGADMVQDLCLMQMAREVADHALRPVGELLGMDKASGGGAEAVQLRPTRYSDYCPEFGEVSPEHPLFLRRLRRYTQARHAFPFLALTSCVAHSERAAVERVPADVAAHIWQQQLLGRRESAAGVSAGPLPAWPSPHPPAARGFFAAGSASDLPPALTSPASRSVAEVLVAADVTKQARARCTSARLQRQIRRAATALLREVRRGWPPSSHHEEKEETK